MKAFNSILLLVAAMMLATSTQAFVTPSSSAATSILTGHATTNAAPATLSSSTALCERRWNFNEGQSPWGLKNNAEIWNGRLAQMAFVIIFLQELIQGKGVIQGISEGDPINLAGLAITTLALVGLTGWLALKGDDDYVSRDLGQK